MRVILSVLLLASAACTQEIPEGSSATNAAESNTFAQMDSAAGPAYDLANAANSADPDTPVASTPIPRGSNATPAPTEDSDACGASKYRNLIGKPRSAVPDGLPPRTRVTCTECPVTMDYSPERLNIFYDQETEIIEEVRCG